MTAPLVRTIQQNVASVATASDDDTVIGQAEFDATVTDVEYIAEAAITGANTNSRTFSLINAGQAGAGTTVIATLAMVSGVNAAANNERDITLSATAADRLVTAGDTLVWRSDSIGTGIADPGGVVKVALTRRDA